MSEGIGEILERSLACGEVSRSDCLRLLQVEDYSKEMYDLLYTANKLTKNLFNNIGEVHAQVGIDYAPCPKKCSFCVFGNVTTEHLELSLEEVVLRAKEFDQAGADAIYLMTTADYDFAKYIKISEAVKKAISPKTPLVANIGDFGKNEAQELSKTGFTAAYHVVRLREGRTAI
jgi:biotin synthase